MPFIAATDNRITTLLTAMGIEPSKTRRVTIEFNVRDVVVMVTEQYATVADIEALTETVKQFRLVPIETEPASE